MMKLLGVVAVVGGLAFLAFGVDYQVTPATRTRLLAAGRSTTGFFSRNLHVADEWMRCCELNPRQLPYCHDRAVRMVQEANMVSSPVKVTDVKSGVGPVTLGK